MALNVTEAHDVRALVRLVLELLEPDLVREGKDLTLMTRGRAAAARLSDGAAKRLQMSPNGDDILQAWHEAVGPEVNTHFGKIWVAGSLRRSTERAGIRCDAPRARRTVADWLRELAKIPDTTLARMTPDERADQERLAVACCEVLFTLETRDLEATSVDFTVGGVRVCIGPVSAS